MRRETTHRFLQPLWQNVERNVLPREAAGCERRVLHPRRARVRDRMAQQRDELTHRYPYWTSLFWKSRKLDVK